ncbi:hypothetical protein DFAR_3150008 [Desulfarculales bacterium]
MPVYTAAILIGVARLLEVNLGIGFNTAVFIFTAITALYVIIGGMKAVIYTDAFQACLMLCIMVVFIFWAYNVLGGFTATHQALTDLARDLAQPPAPSRGPPCSRAGMAGLRVWTAARPHGSSSTPPSSLTAWASACWPSPSWRCAS